MTQKCELTGVLPLKGHKVSHANNKTEIEKFSKLSKDWWNPKGKFRPLHLFNPTRIKFIKEKLIYHFKLNENSEKPLERLKILDSWTSG